MRLRSILLSASATISLAVGLGVGLPAAAPASAGTGHGMAVTMHLSVQNTPECQIGSLPGVAVHLFAEPNAGGR